MQATDPAPHASQASALAAWLRLAHTPGVGRVSVHLLLEHFHTAQAILDGSLAELCSLVSRNKALALKSPLPPAARAAVDAALAWAGQGCHHILFPRDGRYPHQLLQLPDPPLVLYCIGRTELLSQRALAIVGSRNATLQGKANARAFAQSLSEAGVTIVSGLAAGIDAAAHEGGLRGVGSTVAIVGTGADRIYPARNRDLAHAIAQQGCIVSEYALGTPPVSDNFPRRNRLISGVATGVLVVEAARESGSLITARLAIEQGRDVFAVPGSIHSPLAKGCHYLIKEGAKLAECAADVLEELRPGPLADLAAPGDGLLAAMGCDPVDCDTLAALPGMSVTALATGLLQLELAGHVQRLPGGLFQRVIR